MSDWPTSRIWLKRGIFLVLAFALIVMELVPLDQRPRDWAGPDLLLVATLLWVVRKPNYLPALSVALVFLIADLFFLRPPGLWAALVVMLTEALRRRNSEFRNMPFLAEWGAIAFGIVTITVLYRIVLLVVMIPRPPLAITLIEMVATILAYPVVAFVGYFLFGIRRAAVGETGSRGQLI